MKSVLCLVTAASFVVVGLAGCRSGSDRCVGACSQSDGPVGDLGYATEDFAYAVYDLAYTAYDLAIPTYDIGVSDLAYPPNDLAYPPYDLAYPPYDAGHGPHDFGHGHDFGHPPVYDFAEPVFDLATTPDQAGALQACTSCLASSCASQASACEVDPKCVGALSCVIANSCFTFASGSQSFGSCVTSCVSSEGLTIQQEVAVLGEIAALSSCNESCIDICGGH